MKECDSKPSQVCDKECKRNYYCNQCPDTKPTPRPTRPTGPTRPTRPTQPTRPTIGPPSIPPAGTFIVRPPGIPSKFDQEVIDARSSKRHVVP